jgi:hypothetical protein
MNIDQHEGPLKSCCFVLYTKQNHNSEEAFPKNIGLTVSGSNYIFVLNEGKSKQEFPLIFCLYSF